MISTGRLVGVVGLAAATIAITALISLWSHEKIFPGAGVPSQDAAPITLITLVLSLIAALYIAKPATTGSAALLVAIYLPVVFVGGLAASLIVLARVGISP